MNDIPTFDAQLTDLQSGNGQIRRSYLDGQDHPIARRSGWVHRGRGHALEDRPHQICLASYYLRHAIDFGDSYIRISHGNLNVPEEKIGKEVVAMLAKQHCEALERSRLAMRLE